MANDYSKVVAAKEKACEEVGAALATGTLGDIVEKHEKLIMHYYSDVQEQAKRSFENALHIANIGFGVLIVTLAYALILDGLRRFNFNVAPAMTETSLTLAGIGTVSGALIEFIAAIAFVLYSRGAKQFGAFHICLERTHRYLLAYKIADELGARKDETLRDLVCIMANASMIAHYDIAEPSRNEKHNADGA